MPTAPMLSNNPVQTSGLPNVQSTDSAPLEAFGGGRSFASGIEQSQQALAPMMKYVEEEKHKADDIRTKDAYNQATALSNNLQWDPKTGFTQTRGQDSFGIIDDYGAKLKSGLSDIENSLDNNEQKIQFKELSGKISNDFNENMQRHVGVESKKYADEVSQTGVSQAKDYAVLNYQTPGAIESSLATQKQFIEDHGKNNGLPSATIDEMVTKSASAVHHDVIERMSDTGQDILASTYFKNNKTNMTAEDVVRSEKLLEEGSTLGEAQRKSDAIIASTQTRDESLQAVKDEITSPKIREKAISLIDKHYTDQAASQEAAQKQLLGDSINILDKTHDYEALPESTKIALSPANKKFAQDYAKGKEPAANGDQYQTLKLLSMNENTRQQFATTPLSGYQKDMTREEWKELFNTQNQIIAKDKNTTELLDYQDANQKVLRDSLDQAGIVEKGHWYNALTLGITGNVFDKQDLPSLIRYQNDFNQAVKTKEDVLQRKLTTDEASGIASKITSKIVTDSNGVRNISPLSSSEAVSINDIPADSRSALAQELQSKGWPVTEDNIIKFYVKAVQKGVVKPRGR